MVNSKTLLLSLIPTVILCGVAVVKFQSSRTSPNTQSPPASTSPKPLAMPRFVTYHLGEVSLTSDHKWPKGNEISGLYDKEQDYSIRDGDGPDGCEHTLTLRPGSSWEMNKKELQELWPSVHLNLVTGRGVAIGDTPQQVEQKIGLPTLIQTPPEVVSEERLSERPTRYVYIHHGKRVYEAHYDFKNGALKAISFREARLPGVRNGPTGCGP